MCSQQLQIFPETREERLEREVLELREKYETLRKSQFKRLNDLKKMYTELHKEISSIKNDSRQVSLFG